MTHTNNPTEPPVSLGERVLDIICGYKANGQDELEGHIKWQLAQLKEIPHETS